MTDDKPLEATTHPDPRYTKHPGATAPWDQILDQNDLAEIRDALRNGHMVGLGGDGHVYTNHKTAGAPEATKPPITDAQESYVESKMADVQMLLREGWMVSIQPDGTISANPSGGPNSSRFFGGPDKSINAEEMAWIDSAILKGHTVHVYPDRSVLVVEYEKGAPASSLTPDQRQALLREFHESLPELEAKLDEGRDVRVATDGEISWGEPMGPEAGIQFPEPPPPGPAVGSREFYEAKADEMEAQARALRQRTVAEQREQITKLGGERDSEARKEYGANQEANAADRQVTREQAAADKSLAKANEARTRGDRFDAAQQQAEADAAQSRAQLAEDAARQLRAEAATHHERVVQLEAQIKQVRDTSANERAADQLEQDAAALREHAAELPAQSEPTPVYRNPGPIGDDFSGAEPSSVVGDDIDGTQVATAEAGVATDLSDHVSTTTDALGDDASSDFDYSSLGSDRPDIDPLNQSLTSNLNSFDAEPAYGGDTYVSTEPTEIEAPVHDAHYEYDA